MAKIKKFKIKYKVTNKNILIRFNKEQDDLKKAEKKFNSEQEKLLVKNKDYEKKKWDRVFTLNTLADKFGILNIKGKPDKTLACRWISLNQKVSRLPSKTRVCPQCRKSIFQHVEDWINDGSLN